MTGSIVRGRIVLDEGDQSLEGATLHVVLEEVSRADAPAREVGRVDLAGADLSASAPIGFTLTVPKLDPSGSRTFSAGDQITTQSYPVLTRGFPSEVQMRLRKI